MKPHPLVALLFALSAGFAFSLRRHDSRIKFLSSERSLMRMRSGVGEDMESEKWSWNYLVGGCDSDDEEDDMKEAKAAFLSKKAELVVLNQNISALQYYTNECKLTIDQRFDFYGCNPPTEADAIDHMEADLELVQTKCDTCDLSDGIDNGVARMSMCPKAYQNGEPFGVHHLKAWAEDLKKVAAVLEKERAEAEVDFLNNKAKFEARVTKCKWFGSNIKDWYEKAAPAWLKAVVTWAGKLLNTIACFIVNTALSILGSVLDAIITAALTATTGAFPLGMPYYPIMCVSFGKMGQAKANVKSLGKTGTAAVGTQARADIISGAVGNETSSSFQKQLKAAGEKKVEQMKGVAGLKTAVSTLIDSKSSITKTAEEKLARYAVKTGANITADLIAKGGKDFIDNLGWQAIFSKLWSFVVAILKYLGSKSCCSGLGRWFNEEDGGKKLDIIKWIILRVWDAMCGKFGSVIMEIVGQLAKCNLCKLCPSSSCTIPYLAFVDECKAKFSTPKGWGLLELEASSFKSKEPAASDDAWTSIDLLRPSKPLATPTGDAPPTKCREEVEFALVMGNDGTMDCDTWCTKQSVPKSIGSGWRFVGAKGAERIKIISRDVVECPSDFPERGVFDSNKNACYKTEQDASAEAPGGGGKKCPTLELLLSTPKADRWRRWDCGPDGGCDCGCSALPASSCGKNAPCCTKSWVAPDCSRASCSLDGKLPWGCSAGDVPTSLYRRSSAACKCVEGPNGKSADCADTDNAGYPWCYVSNDCANSREGQRGSRFQQCEKSSDVVAIEGNALVASKPVLCDAKDSLKGHARMLRPYSEAKLHRRSADSSKERSEPMPCCRANNALNAKATCDQCECEARPVRRFSCSKGKSGECISFDGLSTSPLVDMMADYPKAQASFSDMMYQPWSELDALRFCSHFSGNEKLTEAELIDDAIFGCDQNQRFSCWKGDTCTEFSYATHSKTLNPFTISKAAELCVEQQATPADFSPQTLAERGMLCEQSCPAF